MHYTSTMRTSRGFTSLVFLLTALACSSNEAGRDDGITVAKSELSRDSDPQVSDAERATLAQNDLSFAADLYARLAGEEGNLFLSPHSISTALAMAYAGTKGTTASEMAETLHYTLPAERLHPAFNRLALDLESRADSKSSETEGQLFQLRIANALFGQVGLGFETPFLDTLAVNYGAGMSLVDFSDEPKARGIINDWVAENTDDKIPELIRPGLLSSETGLVLTNAVYFDADWSAPFKKEATFEAAFTKLDQTTATVDMMHQNEDLPYAKGDGFAALTLPYLGQKVAMTIVLPDEGKYAAVEAGLNAEFFSDLLSSRTTSSVSVALPKWTFDSSFDLSQQLSALGMPTAFSSEADFSAMTTEAPLFIGAVVHKAFVAVDEEGTQAAAATAVIAVGSADPVTQITFEANRPFLFFIHDEPTGALLFMGRLVAPSAAP
jgi:serpin B